MKVQAANFEVSRDSNSMRHSIFVAGLPFRARIVEWLTLCNERGPASRKLVQFLVNVGLCSLFNAFAAYLGLTVILGVGSGFLFTYVMNRRLVFRSRKC